MAIYVLHENNMIHMNINSQNVFVDGEHNLKLGFLNNH
jgi:hypothetical protein